MLIIQARDRASRVLSANSRRIRQWQRTATQAARAVRGAFLGAVAALGLVGKAAFDTYDDFDTATGRVRALTGATGDLAEEYDRIVESIYRSERIDDPNTVVNVLAALSKIRVDGQQIGVPVLEELTRSVVQLALAFDGDPGQVAQRLAAIFTVLEVPLDEQQLRIDQLTRIIQEFPTVGLNELLTGLSRNATLLRAAGLDFGESAEFMARIQTAGIPLRSVGSALTYVIDRANELRETQIELGVPEEELLTVRDHFNDVINEIIRVGPESVRAAQIAEETFGTEFAGRMLGGIQSGIIVPLNEMGVAIEGSNLHLDNVAGATAQAYEDTRNWTDEIKVLTNNLKADLLPLMESLHELYQEHEEDIKLILSAVGNLVREVTAEGTALNTFVNVMGNIFGFVLGSIGQFFDDLGHTVRVFGDMAGLVGQNVGAGFSVLGGITEHVFGNMTTQINFAWETLQVFGANITLFVRKAGDTFSGLGVIVANVANTVIEKFEGMVNGAISGLNNLVDKANLVPGVNIPRIGRISLGRIAVGEQSTQFLNQSYIAAPEQPDFDQLDIAALIEQAGFGDLAGGRRHLQSGDDLLRAG
ncbi:MAG: hypothetical protein OXG72_16680, partial [Acidobacteria bacterium]|nr:hypothetical protein [Acidobacteriota bacterium]